jgi:hypothetical protein
MRRALVVAPFLYAGMAIAAEPPTAPAPAPAAFAVPIGRWLIVRDSVGHGLRKGGGVRFRTDGMDSAEGGKGYAGRDECTAEGAKLTCSGGIVVTAMSADTMQGKSSPDPTFQLTST